MRSRGRSRIMRFRRVLTAVLAAALLELVAAGCGVQASPGAARPPSGRDASSATGPSVPVDSACGLPGSADTTLSVAPPVDEWHHESTSLWPWPSSKEYGPARTTSKGVRECFAYSPQGAVFAAANIAAMWSDPQLMSDRSVVLGFFGHGSQYARLAAKLDAGASPSIKTMEDVRATMAGVRLLDMHDGKAVVDLGFEGSSGGHGSAVSIVYRLVWDHGDWKLQCEDDPPVTATTLPTLTGYLDWKEG